MKKILGILLIAGSLAACNSGTDADSKADSTKDAIDSAAEVKKDMIDSTAEAKKDKVDSLTNKVDSTAGKKDEKKH